MRAIIISAALLFALVPLTALASALVEVPHTISFAKSCTSPTAIGDQYQCSYMVQNTTDEAQDTLTVTGIRDVVHASSGDQDSGNALSFLQIDNCTTDTGACTQSAASCTGAALFGTGTRADPWVGATSCTLPFGSRLNFHSFSHYMVQPGDFALTGHLLKDDAYLTWHDLCNGPVVNTNCVANPVDAQAAAQTVVQLLASSTATQIHDVGHQVVTTVDFGMPVHDFVTVTGQPGHPIPSGNVNIDWFENGGCSGNPTTNSDSIGPLDGAGQLDADTFAFLGAPGLYAFRAHYEGDATYAGSDGPCETLTVVEPTAVQVESLRATGRRDGVLVRWRMGSEVGVLGYNVYRERSGARVRLNRGRITAHGGVAGKSYSYLDRSAPRARDGVRYWLQVVNRDGSRIWKAVRTG